MNQITNEEEISLLEILQFFIRNKNFIFITTTVCFIIGITISLLKKSYYVAESGIIVTAVKSEVVFEPKIQIKEMEGSFAQQIEDRKKTIASLIKSPAVLSDVLSKLEQSNIVVQKKEKLNLETLLTAVDTEITGQIIKVKVKTTDAVQSKFLADEIVKTTIEKLRLYVTEEVSKETLEEKLKKARQEYIIATKKYNDFIQNNKILELSKKIEQLEAMYNYYKTNIISIEKNIWQAKNLKEQLQHGGVTSTGELADALALIKFKSSIFAGSSDLPLKLELTNNVSNERLSKVDVNNVVKEIDDIISILERRKKEFEQELETKNYEKQIQQLRTELEKEKNREKDLAKDKDLAWDSVLSLERKVKEIEIGEGLTENVYAKIAYLSCIPEKPESKGKIVILIVSFLMGIFLGIVFGIVKEIYYKLHQQGKEI